MSALKWTAFIPSAIMLNMAIKLHIYIYININSMPEFSLCVLKHTSFFKCLSYTEIMQKS